MASRCTLTNGLDGLASAVARRQIRHVLTYNGRPFRHQVTGLLLLLNLVS